MERYEPGTGAESTCTTMCDALVSHWILVIGGNLWCGRRPHVLGESLFRRQGAESGNIGRYVQRSVCGVCTTPIFRIETRCSFETRFLLCETCSFICTALKNEKLFAFHGLISYIHNHTVAKICIAYSLLRIVMYKSQSIARRATIS